MGRLFTILLILAASGQAFALELPLSADSHVVGENTMLVATYEDTFVKIARAHDLGFDELIRLTTEVERTRLTEHLAEARARRRSGRLPQTETRLKNIHTAANPMRNIGESVQTLC